MTAPRVLLCLLISIAANTYASGDPATGQEKSSACQGCHGVDGNSYSPEWPNLASQNPAYLRKQVRDFQSGDRKDPTMSALVIGLSEPDIKDIAAYFSQQAVKVEASVSRAGKRLYLGGNRYTHIPACAGCHGPNGAGNDPGAIPALRGQKAGYTAKVLRDYKAGLRTNDRNGIMRDIAAKMSEKEIDNVAAFLAGMGAENED